MSRDDLRETLLFGKPYRWRAEPGQPLTLHRMDPRPEPPDGPPDNLYDAITALYARTMPWPPNWPSKEPTSA